MTFVYKEYEIKIKMVQEPWLQLKIKFYWIITWKLLFSGGVEYLVGRGDKNLVRRKSTGGRIFLDGVMSKFRLLGGLPPVEKTLLSLTEKQRRKILFTILKI